MLIYLVRGGSGEEYGAFGCKGPKPCRRIGDHAAGLISASTSRKAFKFCGPHKCIAWTDSHINHQRLGEVVSLAIYMPFHYRLHQSLWLPMPQVRHSLIPHGMIRCKPSPQALLCHSCLHGMLLSDLEKLWSGKGEGNLPLSFWITYRANCALRSTNQSQSLIDGRLLCIDKGIDKIPIFVKTNIRITFSRRWKKAFKRLSSVVNPRNHRRHPEAILLTFSSHPASISRRSSGNCLIEPPDLGITLICESLIAHDLLNATTSHDLSWIHVI